MAKADYRLCDVCDGKVFYDANLNYEQGRGFFTSNSPPFRTQGEEQYSGDSDLLEKCGVRLDYLGDWSVLCIECAKTHKTAIVPLENPHD